MPIHYVAPFLYPLFPGEGISLQFVVPLQRLLDRLNVPWFTGALQLSRKTWAGGVLIDETVDEIAVREGVAEPPVLEVEARADAFAYVECALTASEAIFAAPMYEIGYAALRTPRGALSIIEMPKFADPRVIDQIRETGRYTLSHTAAYIDPDNDCDEYFLAVNPYVKALTVRLHSAAGASAKHRLPAHSVTPLPIRDLLPEGGLGVAMITAPQRIIAYDLRAPIGRPELPNSIDHLDPFRGEPTFVKAGLKRYVRSTARSALRRVLGRST